MGDKVDAWIAGKTAGYGGQGGARSTDRSPIPVGYKPAPGVRELGLLLLRENLRNDLPKKEGDK